MSRANAAEGLHDIILPAQVSPWPPLTLWLLAAGLLIALLALALWLNRRRHRLAPMRAARQAIAGLDPNARDLPLQVQALLKRTALAYAPREAVAELSEQAWYRWLDQRLPPAEQGRWPELMGNPYSDAPQHGGPALLNHAERVLAALARGREGAC